MVAATIRTVLAQPRACLVEVGTHLVLDAEPAGCRAGEVTLVGHLPRSCGPGELVLADREFLGVPLWRAFTTTGAHLLWRGAANRVLPVDRMLRDGSWLSGIHTGTDPAHTDPVTVRVLAYQLAGTRRAAESYRLVISLLDARRPVSRTLGSGNRLRRAQDPSTRSPRLHGVLRCDPRTCRLSWPPA
ncbi:hypothetical protein STRTUCAR8_10115 [Streptomyces turgidiscabies Car8]|uniref:Transposase IS4-like domain-containing protein n=1 Tax=Streptomyces turgidiscabies (strain Car8) TaxID=698760 RepID=L7FFL6_STRT8|nr:hypothetical protein STRTUCAR8_10115 [Streptomyces turgidiscabies Car8]GAQ72873.1 hypothetical protein T45_04628 [Streptomyces turgidiscabies]